MSQPRGTQRAVDVIAGSLALPGELTVPAGARGIVAFAHGSGSSRSSPRNRQVASVLQRAGLGTLLFDLLTAREERIDRITRELRFDIPRLASRLVGTVDWLAAEPATAGLGVGLFGASTGAAAALIAAAERPALVQAVVSRGGRVDLAGDAVAAVRCPVLMIVGGRDPLVLELNEACAGQVGDNAKLEVIAGATHLFEEPGALEKVSELAAAWFGRHLRIPGSGVPAAHNGVVD